MDLKFYMGVILYYKKMYQEAAACFEECIAMGEDNLHYLTLKGLGSFRAWYFRGLCCEELKQDEEAIISYLKALMTSHDFMPAGEALTKTIDKQPGVLADILKTRFTAQEAESLRMRLARCNKNRLHNINMV